VDCLAKTIAETKILFVNLPQRAVNLSLVFDENFSFHQQKVDEKLLVL